jgi:hypothetical protein
LLLLSPFFLPYLLLDLCTDLIDSISSNCLLLNCLYSSLGGSVIITTPVE